MFENMVLFLVLSVSFLVCSGYLLGDFLNEPDRGLFRIFIVPFLMTIFFGLSLLIAATLLSRDLGRMQEKEKAIEAGVASYIFDANTGKSEFEYLERKENNNE